MRNIGVVVSFLMLMNLAEGLEINLTKEYYDVVPDDVETISLAMMEASHLSDSNSQNHTVGGYEASTTIGRMEIIHHEGRCKAKIFEMKLNGEITLPRLKMGNYPLKIRQAFEEERSLLEQHERVHESIWQNSLQKFEQEIRSLHIVDDESCDVLINEINQKMSKVLDEIMHKNLEFDCLSYGGHLQLTECFNNSESKN